MALTCRRATVPLVLTPRQVHGLTTDRRSHDNFLAAWRPPPPRRLDWSGFPCTEITETVIRSEFGAGLLRADADLLADRFAVHLIDPHGSGGSTPPSDPALYDHIGRARFYDRVRRAIGLERVTVMGHSFGSLVALTYAALFPDVAGQSPSCGDRGGLLLRGWLEGWLGDLDE